MVENLTLSKMAVSFNSADGTSTSELASAFEVHGGAREAPFRLNVTYQIDGQPLTQDARIHLRHSGRFQCTRCQASVKKLFDGFCYPCLQKSAQADRCVLNPVGCHYLAGTCREPEWGQEFCYQPHYVYLAYTDKYKVGITRRQQIPVRWIDQGATMAVLLADVGSRHQAGQLEDFLTSRFADKSHWQKMLKSGNQRPPVSEFISVSNDALQMLREALSGKDEIAEKLRVSAPAVAPKANSIRLLEQARVVELDFPLWSGIPEKIVSLNLDKTPDLQSPVLGIKGQYLFLEQGVFNVRRHEGYVVNCEILN